MEPPNNPQRSTGFILGGFHFLDTLGGLGRDQAPKSDSDCENHCRHLYAPARSKYG